MIFGKSCSPLIPSGDFVRRTTEAGITTVVAEPRALDNIPVWLKHSILIARGWAFRLGERPPNHYGEAELHRGRRFK